MDTEIKSKRGGWGSNFGFLMASIGSAVGLGNIWGSIIAAALLTLLPELLRGLSNYRMLIYAILLIAMMLFNNSSLKKRMLEKRGMKQMEKLERAEKSGKEGA